MAIKRTRIVDAFTGELQGQQVCVKGWVRTRRGNKHIQFVALNDGSTINNLQIVIDLEKFSEEQLKPITTGSSLCVIGTLVASQGKGQCYEVQAQEIEVYGTADPEEYPLQKKGHTLEFLREKAHLRMRTNTFGAVFRIRHHLAFAIHKFFNDKGFFYLHTPLITSSDAEGAGEMFQVTTLDVNDMPRTEDGKIDYSQDFFGKMTSLTVSGQLEGELGATSLGAIYTFGPTFRAEKSNTPRHLAEFWMIEPEMAFYDINDNRDLAEEFIKYCVQYALDHCKDDIEFLNKMYDNTLIDRLNHVLKDEFVRLTYTEGIKMDVLFPQIGEIIGGSEREANYDKLMNRINELHIPMKDMWWYLETRKFGTVPHSGFGLGFERLVLFVTGMANIRDVIPFPRTPNNCEF